MQRGIRYHFFFNGDPNSVFVRSFRRRVEVNGAYEAAGKLSGEGRREGSSEDTGRVSGRFEGVRHAVLYHEHYRRGRAYLSFERLVGYRRPIGRIAVAARWQAQVSAADQLLRGAGRSGWAGRLLLPAVLRESAQLKAEVDVFGQLNYLEVMNHTGVVDKLKNELLTDDEINSLGV